MGEADMKDPIAVEKKKRERRKGDGDGEGDEMR